MQMTAIYIRILSETVASFLLHVYLQMDTGTEKEISHPLYKVLYDEPNPEMTGGITLSNKKDFQFRTKKWE